MPRVEDPNLAMLSIVAERLGPLLPRVVFLGGCAAGSGTGSEGHFERTSESLVNSLTPPSPQMGHGSTRILHLLHQPSQLDCGSPRQTLVPGPLQLGG